MSGSAAPLPEHAAHSYFHPPYITLAHLFHAPRLWGFPSRVLSSYQFQYVVEGAAEYTIEGRAIPTRRGDLIYHAPAQAHEVRTFPDEKYVCISILFDFGDVPYPVEELLGPDRYVGNFAGHAVEQLLTRLIARYHQPGLANHAVCQGLLMQILSEVADYKQEQASQTTGQQKIKTKMVLIRNHIAEHYDRDIKHAELEALSGLSRNYIIVKFRKAFGMTPFDYLTRVRIERAKELGILTNMSIGEIALRVGYADVHTFGRMFKRKTGASFSQFCSAMVT
ncbi:AraC-like ligand binding domain-containing protein [Paenibacillus sp. UNC496MF]|uniref:helix-turn-helix domain-containing protein n=1 Tax=Paenibacillus sp. UNC496MF TaxID=1502753 RepID=UPI0008F25759|nr:helix-turn-helix domain-containing protein [Paenibacillus sp. UNC496MF]SFJ04837.1 AraC-like ligand binding domain-containing protein [Paenibacillus sp. UNC496MF]